LENIHTREANKCFPKTDNISTIESDVRLHPEESEKAQDYFTMKAGIPPKCLVTPNLTMICNIASQPKRIIARDGDDSLEDGVHNWTGSNEKGCRKGQGLDSRKQKECCLQRQW
jgi:hypothetical protein